MKIGGLTTQMSAFYKRIRLATVGFTQPYVRFSKFMMNRAYSTPKWGKIIVPQLESWGYQMFRV